MRSSLSAMLRATPGVLAPLPCAGCGTAVPVHLEKARTMEKVPVLCDGCLARRVAEVKAERDADAWVGEPPFTPEEDTWRCTL